MSGVAIKQLRFDIIALCYGHSSPLVVPVYDVGQGLRLQIARSSSFSCSLMKTEVVFSLNRVNFVLPNINIVNLRRVRGVI